MTDLEGSIGSFEQAQRYFKQGYDELVAATDKLMPAIEAHDSQIARLQAINVELLAALKAMVAWHESPRQQANSVESRLILARAAIARAEE